MKRSHRVNLAAVAGTRCRRDGGRRVRRLERQLELVGSSGSSAAHRLRARHHRDARSRSAATSRSPAWPPPATTRSRRPSNAYFKYVNAHGGIYGRKIVYKYLNDQYDPTITSTVVHQLVLQDNVYAIFNGLGTPTHLAVVKYLNSSKVPDVFVASGCECWNDPSTYPDTFGWQLDYVREGKILGKYIEQHFKGKKIGYFFQDDEFGQDGVKGLDYEIPKSQVVAKESYNPTVTNVGPAGRPRSRRPGPRSSCRSRSPRSPRC